MGALKICRLDRSLRHPRQRIYSQITAKGGGLEHKKPTENKTDGRPLSMVSRLF
jgi:hypothetical protein